MMKLGEEPVRAAVKDAADRLAREGSSYVLHDWWRVMVVAPT